MVGFDSSGLIRVIAKRLRHGTLTPAFVGSNPTGPVRKKKYILQAKRVQLMIENYYRLEESTFLTEKYVYIDIKGELAPGIFEDSGIDVRIGDKFASEDTPYVFVACAFSPFQKNEFINAMADLWREIHIAGYKNYADFCEQLQVGLEIISMLFSVYTFKDPDTEDTLIENGSIYVFLSEKKAKKKKNGQPIKQIYFGNIALDDVVADDVPRYYGLIDEQKKKFYDHTRASKDRIELIHSRDEVTSLKASNPDLVPLVIFETFPGSMEILRN